MKIKILIAALLTLALFSAAHAQALDRAKLDQFFDQPLGNFDAVRKGKPFRTSTGQAPKDRI